MRIARTIWKIPGARRLIHFFQRMNYLLWQSPRNHRVVLERVGEVKVLVLPGVLNPNTFRTGSFFAQSLSSDMIPAGARVLDMGTGSGICALVAAKWASQVVAVDINPEATRCTRINALLNQVENKLQVCTGSLFEPVRGEKFDVILFNPPYLQGAPASSFEQALFDTGVLAEFARQAQSYLTPHGNIILLLSTLAPLQVILSTFAKYAITVVAEKRFVNETLILYEFSQATASVPHHAHTL